MFCVFLILLSLVAIILGVVAATQFKRKGLTINLSHIAYIRFLAGGGFGSMLFGLILSLSIFLIVIVICCFKKLLCPLAVLFYCYIVYSQTVVIISIILMYGIFNAIILLLFLMIYTLLVWFIFLLIMCDLMCLNSQIGYFRNCFKYSESKFLVYVLCLILLTLIFSIVLVILKKYVVLLIF